MNILSPDSAMAQTQARNKANYLAAKAAFNEGDLDSCLRFYAPHHQIRSRPGAPGRDGIRAFLEQSRQTWPDIRIVVEHALAEGEWVMGRSAVTATHLKPVFGAAPSGRVVRTTFWDLHRFDADGLIAESWNMLDTAGVMGELGLMPVVK